MFYEAKGEQDTARSYYSKALDINPLYAYSPDWNCNEVAGRLDMDITEYRVRARREVEEKYLIEFE